MVLGFGDRAQDLCPWKPFYGDREGTDPTRGVSAYPISDPSADRVGRVGGVRDSLHASILQLGIHAGA